VEIGVKAKGGQSNPNGTNGRLALAARSKFEISVYGNIPEAGLLATRFAT